MNKILQSFLVEASTLEELDVLLDKFLKDKEPNEIVSTNLTAYVSPYHQNNTVYVAFVIYSGVLKAEIKKPTFWQKIKSFFK